MNIDPRIIDRPRNFQIVRALSEHFAQGHRKALVQMATGTGKTRVAMAIIKLLINANMIRNVLFIADRIPLVNQAKSNGFKQFFTEPVADLREGFTTSARLYVSTIQTLMGGYPKKLFEKFSPGFFDLIVFDEAHRSIYDKNNLINQYFDAIKIGLTATPREHETKNTYELFECEQNKPTVEYSYDEAVQDKVLVPYNAEIIDTKVLSLGIKAGELTKKQLDENQKKMVSDKIMEPIESLDKESFIVREKLPIIYEIEKNSFNLEKYVDALKKEISPLMILNQGTNPNISSFILNTEKLFGYVLDRKLDKIEKTRQYVQEMAGNILRKDNLNEIRNNRDKIMKVLQDEFWEDLTFDDVEFMVRELAPLMKFYEPDKRKIVQIDAPDLVLSREKYEREIKEDSRLKEFLEKNPFVNKIKSGEGITSSELKKLEEQLTELRPEMTIESIQKYQKKDFVVFLREIMGLTQNNNPIVLIELKFDEFIIKNSNYSSKQLEFLELLKKVFASRKYIELSDLAKEPLSAERPLDYFQMGELKGIIEKCNAIKVC